MINTIESILCDSCQRELIQHTSYPVCYGLELKSIDVNRNNTGLVYACGLHPEIDQTKHFCGTGCLKKYVTDTFPDSLALI